MSATLEEHNELAKWINAHVYVTNFRPLNLREFVLIDGIIYDLLNNVKERVLPKKFIIKHDKNNIIG